MESKTEVIENFLKKLGEINQPKVNGFVVFCKSCGSSNITIYHGCEAYCYYSGGYFTESCGLKCKDCGLACEIEVGD